MKFILYFQIHFRYGVFDGRDGSCVSDFAAQRMPAEILLGQLTEKSSPAEVKDVLREAFLAVERSYFESIDDLLAERANLLCELPEGIGPSFDRNALITLYMCVCQLNRYEVL